MGDTWNALADPTRREILNMLREGDKNAGEIAAAFSISKPSISHHLNVLRQAGLVDAEKKGQNINYSLNMSVVQDMMRLFAQLLDIKEDH